MIRQQIIEQLQNRRESGLPDPAAIVMSQHQERELISELQGIRTYSFGYPNTNIRRIVEFHSIPVEVYDVFNYGNGDVVEIPRHRRTDNGKTRDES